MSIVVICIDHSFSVQNLGYMVSDLDVEQSENENPACKESVHVGKL